MKPRPPALSTRQLAAIAAAAGALLVAVILAFLLAARPDWASYQAVYARLTGEVNAPSPRSITPSLTGKPEFCITCHVGIEEISPSHPTSVFGCVTCHGGERLALDETRAHSTLRGGRNPSDFSVVQASCGQANCHAGHDNPSLNHIDRATRSLMGTYASGIAYVRYSFGAQADPTAKYGVYASSDTTWREAPNALPHLDALPNEHPIDQQFRQNCLTGGCHLTEPASAEPYRYRSTGCAACHYLYDNDGLYKGADPTIPRDEPGHGRIHRLTTQIPFSQCNHCHNRGNYSLRSMSFTPRPDLPPAAPPLSEFMPVRERRLAEYYQPIGQFTRCEWELDCIDCHPSNSVMGDGHLYGAKSDTQHTECRTCHGTLSEPPRTRAITTLDEQELLQALLNPNISLQPGDRVVVDAQGDPFWTVKEISPGRFVETLKVSGETLEVPLVQGSACQQQPDQQASRYCHACHAYNRD